MTAPAFDDLASVLRHVNAELDRTLPQALELAANMVVSEAKTTHGYKDRSGALTNSIQVETVGVRGNMFATVIAAAPYGLPIEEGSVAHDIVPRALRSGTGGKNTPRGRRALRIPLAGGYLFRRKVHHPGTKAVEFLGKALDAKADEIEQVFSDALDLALARAGF